MPEAPELEVVRDYLADHIVGTSIESASVLKPSVMRSLCGDVSQDMPGRTFEDVMRRGKFLLFTLSGGRLLSINPMLTGALQHCPPKQRVYKRTCLKLTLSNGKDLRYIDDKQMGMVYYVRAEQEPEIPRAGRTGAGRARQLHLRRIQTSSQALSWRNQGCPDAGTGNFRYRKCLVRRDSLRRADLSLQEEKGAHGRRTASTL